MSRAQILIGKRRTYVVFMLSCEICECAYFAIYGTNMRIFKLESTALYKLLSLDNYNSTQLLITVKQLNSMLIPDYFLSLSLKVIVSFAV
jgi:hypothetical protein